MSNAPDMPVILRSLLAQWDSLQWVAAPARRQWLPGVGEFYEAYVTEKGGAYVATVTGRTPSEVEARTGMLAAAPALADALEACLDQLDRCGVPDEHSAAVAGRAALRAAGRGDA